MASLWAKLLEDKQLEQNKLKELQQQGFDVNEPLYHGSNASFTEFNRGFNRTANDFYFSPDIETARGYGKHVYMCYGRQHPQADLINDYKLIGELAEDFAEHRYDAVEQDEELESLKNEIIQELRSKSTDEDDIFDWEAEDDPRYVQLKHQLAKKDMADLIMSGNLYGTRGSLQDHVMSHCFGSGYRSVRFTDPSHFGESISVVFNNPSDVVIFKKIS